MSEFKKCPEGHVYDSDLEECPYCNGETIEDELDKLPEIKSGGLKDLADLAMCYLMGPKI